MTTQYLHSNQPHQEHKPIKWPTRMIKKFNSLAEFTALEDSGSGAFSTVTKAIHNESGKVYAIKQVSSPFPPKTPLKPHKITSKPPKPA